MSATRGGHFPNWTFVSTTGPTLDNVSAKAMRAHTTKVNFTRRRLRLVREHADRKKRAACTEAPEAEEGDQSTNRNQLVDFQFPVFSDPALERKLNAQDAFFISHLTQAMNKLHLLTNIPAADAAFAVTKSDWARYLSDPTMLDVSLYFARQVYTARLQHHAAQFVVDAYKGRAIRSVRRHLNGGPNGLSDGLVAAVLILTVLDQALGNVEAWKIHISGLVHIITIRSRNSNDSPPHSISHIIPSTTLQGLLLFNRHDATLLTTIEKTGIFETMFSASGKEAVYLILTNVEQIVELQSTYLRNKKLVTSERSRLHRIVESLDTAIQLNSRESIGEAFISATALSIKIFLLVVLRYTTDREECLANTAIQLMEVLQKPELQLCSSLTLCASLESRFWHAMMGAIAAPDDRTKSFYTSRLKLIAVALALKSWHDALIVLRRFFWIPTIFSVPCKQIMSDILCWQGCTDISYENHN